MNELFRVRRKVVIVTGMLCIAIISGGLFTNAVTKSAGKTTKSKMTIVVNPDVYSPYQSMYPGISIMIKYNGKADKVRYSTNYGSLETWDRGGTWKIKEYGSKAELPINAPMEW